MGDLILNSFPVEIIPYHLRLPFVEYDSWEASTAGRRREYSQFRTYRYERKLKREGGARDQQRIRLVLLSGPIPAPETEVADLDLGELPNLGANLIEYSLARHLESQGMISQRSSFEKLALRRVESSPGKLIHLFSGISFRARRPFRSEPYAFTVSVQWVARALFADRLTNTTLRDLSQGLGVLYTPQGKPSVELQQFENRFIGHVKELALPGSAVIICRDNVLRPIPLADVTLEASPEAIRRYEQNTGSQQEPLRIWRKLQQLSKVLTSQGRRNSSVLRDRLDAIRGVLGGYSKEQLVLPLDSYAAGTVSIGLAPLRVEVPA